MDCGDFISAGFVLKITIQKHMAKAHKKQLNPNWLEFGFEVFYLSTDTAFTPVNIGVKEN